MPKIRKLFASPNNRSLSIKRTTIYAHRYRGRSFLPSTFPENNGSTTILHHVAGKESAVVQDTESPRVYPYFHTIVRN